MGWFLKHIREMLVWLVRMTWEQHQMSHLPSLPSGDEHFLYPALPVLVRPFLTGRVVGSVVGMAFSTGGFGSRPFGGPRMLSIRAGFFFCH